MIVHLHLDFQSYFRMNSIKDTPMTVVTISFKTENDMALWNNQVDAERELLTEKVVFKTFVNYKYV